MSGNTGRATGRIVVGVEGTAASLAAVRWAVNEALLRQASVHLVFVAHRRTRASYSGVPAAWQPEDDDDGRVLLAAQLEAARALPRGRLSAERAAGSPAKVLIDRSGGADLLVLGAARPAGQSENEMPPLLGPVARGCLHAAACPVVVVTTCEEASKPARTANPPRTGARDQAAGVIT